jgi:hypothetical protein
VVAAAAVQHSNGSLETALNWIFANQVSTDDLDDDISSEPLKMVMIVRTDLKMSSGKVAAQCVHAAVISCH